MATDFTTIASEIVSQDWNEISLDTTEDFVVQRVLNNKDISHNPSTVRAALSALRKASDNG